MCQLSVVSPEQLLDGAENAEDLAGFGQCRF